MTENLKASLFSYGVFANNFLFLILSTVVAQSILDSGQFVLWLFFGLPIALFFAIDAGLANIFTRSLIFARQQQGASDRSDQRSQDDVEREIGVVTAIEILAFITLGWCYLRFLGEGILLDGNAAAAGESFEAVFLALISIVVLNSLSLPHRSLMFAREKVLLHKQIQFLAGLVKLCGALVALFIWPGFISLVISWLAAVLVEYILYTHFSGFRWRIRRNDWSLKQLSRQRKIIIATIANRLVLHFSVNAASLVSVSAYAAAGVETQSLLLFLTRILSACEAIAITPMSVSIPTIVRKRAAKFKVDAVLSREFIRMDLVVSVLFFVAFALIGLSTTAIFALFDGSDFNKVDQAEVALVCVFAFLYGSINVKSSAHIMFFETVDRNPFLLPLAARGLAIAFGTNWALTNLGLTGLYALQFAITLAVLFLPAFLMNLRAFDMGMATYWAETWSLIMRTCQKLLPANPR